MPCVTIPKIAFLSSPKLARYTTTLISHIKTVYSRDKHKISLFLQNLCSCVHDLPVHWEICTLLTQGSYSFFSRAHTKWYKHNIHLVVTDILSPEARQPLMVLTTGTLASLFILGELKFLKQSPLPFLLVYSDLQWWIFTYCPPIPTHQTLSVICYTSGCCVCLLHAASAEVIFSGDWREQKREARHSLIGFEKAGFPGDSHRAYSLHPEINGICMPISGTSGEFVYVKGTGALVKQHPRQCGLWLQ